MSTSYKKILKQKNDRINEWLKTDIEKNTNNKDVVYEMLGEICFLINEGGHKFTNIKQFKHDLTCYVYTDST